VDIDLKTFNLDPAGIAGAINNATVGIIPVHLFGLIAPMQAICEAVSSTPLWIVEDAACAFGSRQAGHHAGTFGATGCFSFHPRKSITTGEGGMILTDDDTLARRLRSLRDHGATQSDFQRHNGAASFILPDYPYAGYNYRMTDLQGAIGVAQMARADWLLAERRRCASFYDQALSDQDWLVLPTKPQSDVHSYQAYVCLYRPELPSLSNVDRLGAGRDGLMSNLEARGIASRPGTHAPVTQTFYVEKYGLRPEDFPNAVLAERLSFALPTYAGMTDRELSAVVDAILAIGPA
jgi:dTDP-4-amino-4,6-dideoxygalactose transaminase